MSLLRFLFGTPQTRFDPFWGTMTFCTFKRQPENSYFEVKKLFGTSGHVVTLTVGADLDGPMTAQKNFLENIESQYDELQQILAPIIEAEFQKWILGFTVKDFATEFSLAHIDLPRCEQRPVLWTISFETTQNGGYYVEVKMEDMKPLGIFIES